MKTGRRRLIVAGAALGLVAAACGGSDSDEAGEGSATTAAATADTTATTAAATTTAAAEPAPKGAGQVTVYLGRHYGIEKVFEQFTAETGIKVRFTTGGDPVLRERIKTEGKNTPADVFITADAANLELAQQDNLLAPIGSAEVEAAIPARLRDTEGTWAALSRRARTLYISPARVPASAAPTSYGAIGDPKWKGKVCLRPATHPYTQSLVAALIAENGEPAAEAIVRSWVANEPQLIDSDTKILETIEAGGCDVAIANTYYLGRLQAEKPQFGAAITFPTEAPGTHVNISGAGLVANAPNPDAGRTLITWLATKGQRAFADANFEYPAATGVEPRPEVARWGTLNEDPIPVERYGELQPAAVKLLDRVGYR